MPKRGRNKRKQSREPSARRQFEELVDQAVAELPKQVRRTLQNIAIVVETEPDPDLLEDLGFDPREELFGLYVGVPLPERHYGEEPYLPDQIFIFQGPLQRTYRNPNRLREQIRITLIHEIAHYYGFGEDRLQELGLG